MSVAARRPGILVSLAFLLGYAGCTSDPGTVAARSPREVPARATSASQAALQLSDLPDGFRRCPYSADIDTYLANIKDVNPEDYRSVSATWETLRQAGATGAYAAYYGNNDRACRNMVLPPDQRDFGSENEHVRDHPKMLSSVVIQFPDEAAAEAAYRADYFGQSRLKDEIAMDVAEGAPTLLGPYAVVAASQGSPIPFRQAIWQAAAFNVVFRSTALDRRESETVTTAMNLRIR